MANKLTKETVIARSKISDLSKVKRLNCWGCDLVDVSLLRKMPNVEILSLSINKINSLRDFQYCFALQELYIRQNDICDLNQICYLQGLSNLKNLWLAENPCAVYEDYRMTVLKTLPQLQKLDNIAVLQHELREAAAEGKILIHPEHSHENEEDEYIPQNQYQRYNDYQTEPEYSPQQSPSRSENDYDPEDYYVKKEVVPVSENHDYSPSNQPSPPRRQESTRQNYSPEQEYGDRRSNTYEQEYTKHPQYYDDYTTGDKYSQHNYRKNDKSENSNHSHEAVPRQEKCACPGGHQAPFNRRPVTRNSNILSAVLCLVKELEYPSLEVVEMAVRCRMDELEE